jgi:transposase
VIATPGNVRVWLATGHTDMRRGFPSLARLDQESLKRDPHAGDLNVFSSRRGDVGGSSIEDDSIDCIACAAGY